jgi:hypothetical protein
MEIPGIVEAGHVISDRQFHDAIVFFLEVQWTKRLSLVEPRAHMAHAGQIGLLGHAGVK